jgi:hypothetical protein
LTGVVVFSGDGEEEQADSYAEDEDKNWWWQGNVG